MVNCQQIQKRWEVGTYYYNHSALLCSSCQVYPHHRINHCNGCVKFELNDKSSKSGLSVFTVHYQVYICMIFLWFIY